MADLKKTERIPAPAFIPKFGALSGMRVLLTGTIVAGPFTATLLAENGAEVIHAERPGGDNYRLQSPVVTLDGDDIVIAGPEVPMDKKVSTAWIQEGRNKLSLTFNWDLRIPEAKEVFFALIRQVDVYVENILWTEKLGIRDEELLSVNPQLVICHISGFGRKEFGEGDGWSTRRCYDPIAQMEGGWMNLNGFPDGPPVCGASFINDYITAYYATIGIVMAYNSAQKTGRGQVIDASQIESMSKGLNDCFVNYFLLGMIKERSGNATGIFQPGDLYKAKNNYLYIGSSGEASYNKFVKAIGTSAERFPYHTCASSKEAINSPEGLEFKKYIQDWVKSRTAQEGFEHLSKFNVACAIPKNIKEVAESAHYQVRNDFIEYVDETLGKKVKAFGFAPKMGGTPQKIWRGGPKIGQDTEVILKTLAGLGDPEMAALKEKGIID